MKARLLYTMNKEVGLLYTMNREAGFVDTAESRSQLLLILVRGVSVQGQSSICKHQAGKSYSAHFLHTLSAFKLGPEEGFATFIELRHCGP